MTLFTYNEAENKQHWINEIRRCDWGAAKFLADILEQNRVEELLGGGEVFLLVDGEKIVSFCTLTKNDCVKDDGLFPWIGFLFTAPEYRGNAYSGILLQAAYELALKMGHERVYLATDHIGFYEKFGFTYMENRIDIYGDDSRIYVK